MSNLIFARVKVSKYESVLFGHDLQPEPTEYRSTLMNDWFIRAADTNPHCSYTFLSVNSHLCPVAAHVLLCFKPVNVCFSDDILSSVGECKGL